ncbi:MAG TPA: hypothetical protein ENI51_07835 [Candidatus Atribacteria bacterium]|nr:hypothetical protein [Candidatus Atribacteria bacterium]
MSKPDDVILSTAYDFEFLTFVIVALIIFIAYFLFIFFKNRKYKELENFLLYGKVVMYCILIILSCVLILSNFIIIEITYNTKYANLVFTLINALLLGVYINITFGNFRQNQKIRFVLLIFVLYILFTGITDLGLRLTINTEEYIPFILAEKVYENNTPQGIRFMWLNIGTLSTLFGLSFLLEQKEGS